MSNEEAHMFGIKQMSCGLCKAAGPSDAHHILEVGRRISHFMVIPLCKDCHTDAELGIHGRKIMWKTLKMTVLKVLAETIEKLGDKNG